MVRVNGIESAAVFMNMYPDPSVGKNVIHLHISVPDSETALWGTDDALTTKRIGVRRWGASGTRRSRDWPRSWPVVRCRAHFIRTLRPVRRWPDFCGPQFYRHCETMGPCLAPTFRPTRPKSLMHSAWRK